HGATLYGWRTGRRSRFAGTPPSYGYELALTRVAVPRPPTRAANSQSVSHSCKRREMAVHQGKTSPVSTMIPQGPRKGRSTVLGNSPEVVPDASGASWHCQPVRES